MAPSDPAASLTQHVVVVGGDSTTARLVEELVRAGEQLVVVARRDARRGVVVRVTTDYELTPSEYTCWPRRAEPRTSCPSLSRQSQSCPS